MGVCVREAGVGGLTHVSVGGSACCSSTTLLCVIVSARPTLCLAGRRHNTRTHHTTQPATTITHSFSLSAACQVTMALTPWALLTPHGLVSLERTKS